jgi:hypothetical protein
MENKVSKTILEEYGYQVQNLWSIEDVKANYNCTDAEAMIISLSKSILPILDQQAFTVLVSGAISMIELSALFNV